MEKLKLLVGEIVDRANTMAEDNPKKLATLTFAVGVAVSDPVLFVAKVTLNAIRLVVG